MRKKDIEKLAKKTLEKYENPEFLKKMQELYDLKEVQRQHDRAIKRRVVVKSFVTSLCVVLLVIFSLLLYMNFTVKPQLPEPPGDSDAICGDGNVGIKTCESSFEELASVVDGCEIKFVDNATVERTFDSNETLWFIVKADEGAYNVRIVFDVSRQWGDIVEYQNDTKINNYDVKYIDEILQNGDDFKYKLNCRMTINSNIVYADYTSKAVDKDETVKYFAEGIKIISSYFC